MEQNFGANHYMGHSLSDLAKLADALRAKGLSPQDAIDHFENAGASLVAERATVMALRAKLGRIRSLVASD